MRELHYRLILLLIICLPMISYGQDSKFNCDHEAFLFQGNPTGMHGIGLFNGSDTLYTDTLLADKPNHLNGFGYNVKDDKIWGCRPLTNQLVRVSADYVIDTIVEIIGLPANQYNTGDVDTNGILYLYSFNGSVFQRVDLNPSSPTYLTKLPPTSITPQAISDWAVSPINGYLYAVSFNSSLIEVSPNGATQNFGVLSGDNVTQAAPFGAAYMDSSGTLYVGANSGGKIFSIENPHLGNTVATLFSIGPSSGFNDGAKCNLSGPRPASAKFLHLAVPDVLIGPVPLSGQLNISTDLDFITNVEIFELSGKKLIDRSVRTKDETLDVDRLKSGMYLLRLTFGSGAIISRKLTK